MRRFLFLLPPVMAMWLACMQTAPGESGCDEVRIGGNSVGCGNPTKAYALKEVVDINCPSGKCSGHFNDGPLKRHLNVEIVNGQLRITVEPLPDSVQKTIRIDDGVHILTRLFNHNPVVDTLPLGAKSFFGNKILDLDYNYFCGLLDVPDKACSLGKVDTVDLMLEVAWNPILASPTELFKASAYLGPIRLIVGDTNLSLDPFFPLDDTLLLKNDIGDLRINVPILPVNSESKNHHWVVFLPGTNLLTASCWEDGRFDLSPIPSQKSRVFLAEIQNDPPNARVSIHALTVSPNQVLTDTRIGMEIGDLIYTLPTVKSNSIFMGPSCQ
jgi:hypothetical protein